MRPDAAASMPAFSIVHPSTRTLLIISAIPARCPLPEWMKTGKLVGSLAAFRNGSMGAGSSVIGLIAKTRYFIPAASVAARSAALGAPPARSITVLIPRFFNAGIAISRDVIDPPVETVLSTNQKLLMPGTVNRLLICANDNVGKPAITMRMPVQRSKFRLMGMILAGRSRNRNQALAQAAIRLDRGLQVHPAINGKQDDFPHAMPKTLRGCPFDRTIGRGGRVGGNSVIDEHFFHAEEVKTIADDKNRFPALGVNEVRCGPDAVVCCATSLLRHNAPNPNAALDKIVCADLGFGEVWIGAVATRRDNRLRVSLRIEVIGVVQPRLQDGRRPAVILSGAEYNDGVRFLCLVSNSVIANLAVEVHAVNRNR